MANRLHAQPCLGIAACMHKHQYKASHTELPAVRIIIIKGYYSYRSNLQPAGTSTRFRFTTDPPTKIPTSPVR